MVHAIRGFILPLLWAHMLSNYLLRRALLFC